MVTPDIHYIYHKNPEKFTNRDLNQIMEYMTWKGRHKVIIAFKSADDLNQSLDYLIDYIEERVDFKVDFTMIRANVVKFEKRGDEVGKET